MSLRIPLTRDQTLQTEFHEIERRLRRIERKTGVIASGSTVIQAIGGSGVVGSSTNLTAIISRIEALEAAIASLPEPGEVEIPVFGAVGSTSAQGVVPEPGITEPPDGIAQHLLTEDATWGFPLRGLIGVGTSGAHTDPPYDVVNLEAALTAGHVAAGDVTCHNLLAMGDAWVGAFSARLVSKTAAYTATTSDHVILVDASAGNTTVTLPAVATCPGLILHIKKTDSSGYYVRLDGNSSETIDGDTTFDLLLQGENLMIQSSGARWNVL